MDKKIALVTGASRGIGRATALKLAQAGVHVIALARTLGALEELDDEITAAGGSCTLIPQDLAKLEDLDKLGPALLEKFGRLDIFVANAGMLGTLGPIAHASPKEVEKVFRINVFANQSLLRTLDPLLRLSPAAQVVFLTTGDGVMEGAAYWSPYGMSKAALQSMANSYAAETRQTRIVVHAHNPGGVRTAMRALAKPGEDPETLPSPEEAADKILRLIL